MTPGQRGVALWMAIGALWSVGLLWGGATFWPVDGIEPLDLVASWLLLPALCLIAMIGRMAQRRFFTADLFDGSRPTSGTGAAADASVLQNTLEQAVLAALVWPALALALPGGSLGAIPALALGFVLCRALFWIGYRRGAVARAFGFTGTFYPTVLAAIWTLWLWTVA